MATGTVARGVVTSASRGVGESAWCGRVCGVPDCVSEASDLGFGMPRRLGHEKPLASAREGMRISAMHGGESVEEVECGERGYGGCEGMPDCVSEASDLGFGKPRCLGHEKPLVLAREGICSSAMQEEESVCHFLGEEKVCAMERSGEERERRRRIDRSMSTCVRG